MKQYYTSYILPTWGARWLSGRVSDSGARGRGIETYRRRVVSLSKTLYSPRKRWLRPDMTEKLLTGTLSLNTNKHLTNPWLWLLNLGPLLYFKYTPITETSEKSSENNSKCWHLNPIQMALSRAKLVNFSKTSVVPYVYKALNGQTPEFISGCFKKVSETHNRNLRSVDNDLLHNPNSRTKFYENSFTASAAKLWNQIPLHIRNINCLNSFNTALKSYLQAN